MLALVQLNRSSDYAFRRWRDRLDSFGRTDGRVLGRIATALRTVPDLLSLIEEDDTEFDSGRSRLSRECVEEMVEDFRRRAIEPYWERMLDALMTERNTRLGEVSENQLGGLGEILTNQLENALHRGRKDTESDGDFDFSDIRDNGLIVAPSVFLGLHPGLVLHRPQGTGGRPVFIYSLPRNPDLGTPWGFRPSALTENVSALIGRTRARILRLTTVGGTTGELARYVGTSAASISQHTSVLRDAGLITSERDCNTVTHTVTALGVALLNGLRLSAAPLGTLTKDAGRLPHDLAARPTPIRVPAQRTAARPGY